MVSFSGKHPNKKEENIVTPQLSGIDVNILMDKIISFYFKISC